MRMNQPSHEKRTPTKYTNKLKAFRTLADMVRTGRYKEEANHKAGVGANCPRVRRLVIRMHIIT